jgi:hypothetical protein
MKLKLINLILVFFLLQTFCRVYSQHIFPALNNHLKPRSTESGGTAIAFTAFVFFSTLNPILLLEDKKIYGGLTRELTLGFGKQGEYRISAEYSFLFRTHYKHHIRLSAKYDILTGISRSEWLDTRYVFSTGAGYFYDGNGNGIFPEITAGVRIGESEYLLIPYVKLRHTFMLKKNKPDNSDFSLGMIIGIKPF